MTGGAAGGAGEAGALPPAADVVVVGGGITGLTAAWALRRRGLAVVLLEGSARAGGSVATHRGGGYLAELGPNSLFETPAVAALVEALGLAGERLPADEAARRRYVVRGGRLVALPASPPALLTTPILSARAKLRLALEPFARAAPRDGESVAALVRRRFGAEALAYLVDPFVNGTCAGDPARLSARHALPALAELEARHGSVLVGAWREARARRRAGGGGGRPPMISFRRGLATLTDALADALGPTLRLGTRALAARRRGAGWAVDADAGGRPATIVAGAVVLAGPAHSLESIELPAGVAALAAPIARLAHAPVATLALGFPRAAVAHPLDGFGALVPTVEGRDLLGVLFNSSVFPDRAPVGEVLLTCFVGGVRRPELAALPHEALLERVRPELAALVGAAGAPTFVRRTRWPRAIPQYELGHEAVLAAVERVHAAEPRLALAGQYVAGAALGDCVAAGQGAAERAACALAAAPGHAVEPARIAS